MNYPAIFLPYSALQGSKICCTLFNLFNYDIPVYPFTHLAKYADNTCVFSVNRNRHLTILAITRHLKLLSELLRKWRIALYINKTQAIIFSNLKNETRDKYKIVLNNNELPMVNTL